jgi:putative sigma-54 modulation protein
MRVQTHAIQFSADQKLIDYIEEKLAKLHVYFDQILDVDVFLKLETHHAIKDKVAEVRVHLPGTVVVVKESAKTFEAALLKSLQAMRRQILRYKEKYSTK